MPSTTPARTPRSAGEALGEKSHASRDPDRIRRRNRRVADLSASVTVFLIALPLSLGIALTAGAPLQAGLVAAAVGGIVGGRLGGAPLQIGGPAAGLTVVTADLINVYGWRTTCALTVGAGLVQLVLGRLRVARSVLVVSPAIVHGMLAGIGVTIALAQLHIVLGGSPERSAVANLAALPGQLAGTRPTALAVSALTVGVLLGWPWLRRLPGGAGGVLAKVPGPLAAVGLATIVATAAGLGLARVDLPSWRSHALPQLPEGPLLGLLAGLLTIMMVSGVQTLLSAVAMDKLTAARTGDDQVPRADLDRELRGLGASNVVSGALGGLPVAGVAVRSSANVAAGAVSRNSSILHGVWVLLAAGLAVAILERIPLAALAALVMVVGVQMVKISHIRTVTRHREALVYAATFAGVVLLGVLEGVGIGIVLAVAVALNRLAHTRITTRAEGDVHRVHVRGQLTFLAVPRLSRALARVPEGADAVVELDGSFMDHAAFETLQEWRATQEARGGGVEVKGREGRQIAEPSAAHGCSPWMPWRNHQCTRPTSDERPEHTVRRGQLLGGVRNFQRSTAPRVRKELARLAAEGQRPSQLFLTCADSRLVTSMITSSGPGDLFTVRNIGNLVPLPGEESGDDSVAAAIEYAVEVLEVESITVCGHSGCGAMQALHTADGASVDGSLGRWLRHGASSVRRAAEQPCSVPSIPGRTSDALEALCLANVVQQLEHLVAHPCVAQRVARGALELHGMYFHVGEAQAYVMDLAPSLREARPVFLPVQPEDGEMNGEVGGQDAPARSGCAAHASAGGAGPS
ncbi:SulP family inorganic anion transporter [Streptomyces sp. DSM 42041]|uniref:SulP family inorganic anion transporter n=1 Tax=Streptomyces hazeniae TaxID=3075538 RepID=A0ABU2NTF4_9ACTN|nr:SulP family inorganic anion transporter [Streptomyces sp. DSM 42041]MDT0380265.1 SulP family inorganic anion transporter [Streptomyces sp. DSM 42041]